MTASKKIEVYLQRREGNRYRVYAVSDGGEYEFEEEGKPITYPLSKWTVANVIKSVQEDPELIVVDMPMLFEVGDVVKVKGLQYAPYMSITASCPLHRDDETETSEAQWFTDDGYLQREHFQSNTLIPIEINE